MEDIKWCPQHGYPLPCHKCGMPLSKIQQKDIYQAGIREVVEWIEENDLSISTDVIKFNPDDWQAQKKVWGIEPKK